MINKILISGLGGDHDLTVRNSFVQGYQSTGGLWLGDAQLHTDNLDFDYARVNGFQVIIRSMSGALERVAIAQQESDIMLFMPAGSNNGDYCFPLAIPSSLVVTGAGDTYNRTGYKVEFFDIDPTNRFLSSFSNGYIAGKIAYIANSRNCTMQEAREVAMMTASNYSAPTDRDGFGVINVDSAIRYRDLAAPYVERPTVKFSKVFIRQRVC